MKRPGALPLNEYEEALNQYFSNFCHRDASSGWVRDKFAVGDDPDYATGGGDTLSYEIDLKSLPSVVASVEATLYYQAIPPFYL